jgi:ABC-type multidrug transport system ATPase subunit
MRSHAALPPGWTAQRYLEQSALLGGSSRTLARDLARGKLRSFELEALSSRLLGTLSKAERRLLLLVNAALLSPTVLLCEQPLDRLESACAERVARALDRAAEACALLVSVAEVPALGAERVLLDRSDTLVVLEAGSITFAGTASEWSAHAGALLVTVSDNWEAFGAALGDRGLSVTPEGFVDALHVLELPREGARFFRFVVELPRDTTNAAIFEVSLAARAPIVELRRLPGAS